MSMLESDSLPPPPSMSESSSRSEIALRGNPGRGFCPIFGLVLELVLPPRERGEDNSAEEVFLRGRGVFARMVSMSGLSGRFARLFDPLGESLTSTLSFLRLRIDPCQGRVGESRRDGSLSLLSDRFLAVPNMALASLGLCGSSENSPTRSSSCAESSWSMETMVSVLDMAGRAGRVGRATR